MQPSKSQMRRLCIALEIVLLGLPSFGLLAQTSNTGSIVGTVLDPSGQVVPHANITLTNEATSAKRAASSGDLGAFELGSITPGTYTLQVECAGFKKYENRNLHLAPNERLSVGGVQLEVGSTSESVTVTAQGAAVQSTSSENSGLLTAAQFGSILVRGRDMAQLAFLLPGVVPQTVADTLNFQGSTMAVNGNRQFFNNTSIDGLQSTDLVGSNYADWTINMEAVSEVTVLLSNYQAEYGRVPGAQTMAITKSGSKDFHGAGYWFKRHEMFNANTFFNNRNGVPLQRYRYSTLGFNLGGPVYIPGKFNSHKDKLFFFYSGEFWWTLQPQPLRQFTMPTALERGGDFSQTVDLNGKLVPITDPLTRQPFPDNKIPANRINANGQALLNVFPQPNFTNNAISQGQYNYVMQESLTNPKHQHVLRVDYNVSDKTSLYFRGAKNWDNTIGIATPLSNSLWGLLPNTFLSVNQNGILHAQRILGPSMVLDGSFGWTRKFSAGPAQNQSDVDKVTRKVVGFAVPQFHPEINPLNLIPNASFGGGPPNAGGMAFATRFPLHDADNLWVGSVNLSKMMGSHSLKAGFYVDFAKDAESEQGNFTGTFDFQNNVTNTNNSNWPWSNALLGNYYSYSESTSKPPTRGRYQTYEWYLQDNWKVSRRLTLEFGMRFYWTTPEYPDSACKTVYCGMIAGFVPGQYTAAKAVTLYRPTFNSSGARVGMNPLTGELVPAVLIGAEVPGVGDPANGMVVAYQSDYPRGLADNRGVQYGPRFGLSYDPFGNGRTAIRGGFGLFPFTRGAFEGNGSNFSLTTNPPLQYNPTMYYGNLATLSQSSSVVFPGSANAVARSGEVPNVMNFNLGIQQSVGFGTVVNIGYVGTLGRHLLQTNNLNALPYGTNFLSSSQDPTQPGKPLPSTFLVPYPGYGNITYYNWGSYSDYNSLQVTVNRRYAKSVQYGLSYTWSKAMDLVDAGTSAVANFVSPRVYNYGKSGFDRTHMLVANWIWSVPKASRMWSNIVTKAAFDDWQISGILTLTSGAPSGIGYSLVQSTDITGSTTEGSRVVLLANPVIPKSQRTFDVNFNTAAFGPPAVGTWGNAAKDLIRLPGVNNWNLALFKVFPLHGENTKLELRWETYNTPNHTQFSGLDTTARFDPTGKQVSTTFGRYTAGRDPRYMQVALKLMF